MTKDIKKRNMIDIINYDPIHEAETFLDQTDTDESMGLGFLLNMIHGRIKEEVAKNNFDSHLNMKIWEYRDILKSLQFERILQFPFKGSEYNNYQEDLFEVHFHQKYGIVLRLDSYGTSLNSCECYFNWRPFKEEGCCSIMFKAHLSGGWNWKDPNDQYLFYGHFDGREAIRAKIELLLENGNFVTPWVKMDMLYLTNYMEWKQENFNVEKTTKERILLLPQHVQDAITIKEIIDVSN